MLDKIIRMQPNFRKIYVMIREKKNMSLAERFEQQIFSSELFQPLFQRQPELKRQLSAKIEPIAGDLIINQLGLS